MDFGAASSLLSRVAAARRRFAAHAMGLVDKLTKKFRRPLTDGEVAEAKADKKRKKAAAAAMEAVAQAATGSGCRGAEGVVEAA